MARIHIYAVKADKLVATAVIVIAVFGIIGYFTLLGGGLRQATPVPKALLVYSLPVSTTDAPPPTAAVGALAPDFTLQSVDGKAISLAQTRGKPVLLYFWASWCSFCRDDMPGLQKLQEEKKDAGLTVLAINLLEKAELVKGFAAQVGLSIPLLLDSNGTVSATYMVRATPTYAFIGNDGVLKAQVVGRPRPALFDRNLSLILGDQPQSQQMQQPQQQAQPQQTPPSQQPQPQQTPQQQAPSQQAPPAPSQQTTTANQPAQPPVVKPLPSKTLETAPTKPTQPGPLTTPQPSATIGPLPAVFGPPPAP